MKLNYLALFGSIFLVAFIFGCIGGGGDDFVNETKLEENEGLGIIGTLKVDKLNPGLDGYLSLTVRNNLGGQSASRVHLKLDNVMPFEIFDCGGYVSGSELDIKRICPGSFDLDPDLPYTVHGLSKMFPGEEVEFFWRLRAPSAGDIANIALKHKLYYVLEYDYKTTFTQNIIFMEQEEVFRRRQSGETYEVEGDAATGAGALRISGTTQQPIVFFSGTSSDCRSTPEKCSFSFPLRYAVENKGVGLPLSDVIILFELPKIQKFIEPTSDAFDIYGWQTFNDSWDGKIETITGNDVDSITGCDAFYKEEQRLRYWRCNCNTGLTGDATASAEDRKFQNCGQWINDTYGGPVLFGELFKDAYLEDRLLVKVVKREDFAESFDIFLPLKLDGTKWNQWGTIPIHLIPFKVHNMYRYFVEGDSEITIFPIKV